MKGRDSAKLSLVLVTSQFSRPSGPHDTLLIHLHQNVELLTCALRIQMFNADTFAPRVSVRIRSTYSATMTRIYHENLTLQPVECARRPAVLPGTLSPQSRGGPQGA